MKRTIQKTVEAGQSAKTYSLHGLRVCSDIPLSARSLTGGDPDVTVVWGERRVITQNTPAGQVIAQCSFGNGAGYTHTQTEGGYTLRFHTRCEFQIDRELRSVTVHLSPTDDPEFAALLLAGNVMAFILTLMGECVLHASAVEFGDVALAFVGRSGGGKSTLAALCCAGGAKLITDDLLRLDMAGDPIRCFASTAEIRLRPRAAALADLFSGRATRSTADRRLAIHLDVAAGPRPRLGAIVIPRPTRNCQTLGVERLPATRALYLLSSYPRVIGWQNEELIRQQFVGLARVAKTVPIFQAVIPWGPPFAADLPIQLRRAAGLGTEMETSIS